MTSDLTTRPRSIPQELSRLRWRALRRRLRALLLRGMALLAVFLLVGGSAPDADALLRTQIADASTGWVFNLVGWEVGALEDKAHTLWNQPAAGLSAQEGAALVQEYLALGEQVRRAEGEINRILSENMNEATEESRALGEQAATLRAKKEGIRRTAEAVLEGQIAWTLHAQDLGIGARSGLLARPVPPVLFAFSESPRKLVISPRERIRTAESRILNPGMPLEEIEATERAAEEQTGLSAYVAATGGMGAFPTMVVDTAPVDWILSTVAHEWVHTYLSLFPLGFSYGVTSENTTINETVAEIVGDEIGAEALHLYYPALAAAPERMALTSEVPPLPEEDSFDFGAEMRQTRLTVDKFLAVGRVEDAERYMELRRLLFVENGFALRRLNQAYFAFHGSYGTGAAADVTSPDAIAPRVIRLRELTPDLAAFLVAVRGITDAEGLDRVLGEWEGR